MIERLKSTLGECCHSATCSCRNKTAYEQTSTGTFHIYDPPNEERKPVRIVSDTDDYQLTINNTDGNTIHVVKTDKCLFPENIAKCDCMLFDNHRFYFVEIKSGNSGNRRIKRADAVRQLGATIDNLIANGINLSNFDTRAIICFKRSYPYVTCHLMMLEQPYF